MKAWAMKTLGTVAAVGTFAPLALVAAWYALDGNAGPSDSAATEQHGLTGQNVAGNDGLDLIRAISSTKASRAFGQMIVPAASGELTLAAFGDSHMLEPANIIVVGSGAPPVPILLASADDGAPGNSGFGIFRNNAAGSSRAATAPRAGSLGTMTNGVGMISGPGGGGGSAVRPETLHLLQASGGLGDFASGPGTGGPGFGYNVTLQVTPLPPAILAFLSGLAALFAFRRARGRAAEPAVG